MCVCVCAEGNLVGGEGGWVGKNNLWSRGLGVYNFFKVGGGGGGGKRGWGRGQNSVFLKKRCFIPPDPPLLIFFQFLFFQT